MTQLQSKDLWNNIIVIRNASDYTKGFGEDKNKDLLSCEWVGYGVPHKFKNTKS